MAQPAILPHEFKRRLDAGEVDLLFDLRDEKEFAAWHIEGRTPVESLNISHVDFVGEEEKYLDRLPRDKRIVVICAHGDSSRYSAEILQERGFDAVSLEGGMDGWSEYYELHRVSRTPEVHQLYRVSRGCLSHLVVSGGEAAVIDAPRHTDRLLEAAAATGARITHVFDTHLQADHLSGVREIAAKTGAVLHLHPADFGKAAYAFQPLINGERIAVGTSVIEVLHAPGHTPGSCALLIDGNFLCGGDTIQKASLGRPDLGGKVEEWTPLLHATVFERFARLADDILVLPTHAASAREQDEHGLIALTMAEARRGDLYSRRDYADFLAYVKASLPVHPERYDEIRSVNLGLLDPDAARRKELEIGKNLCGMTKRS